MPNAYTSLSDVGAGLSLLNSVGNKRSGAIHIQVPASESVESAEDNVEANTFVSPAEQNPLPNCGMAVSPC
jgi:hypothetical protein